MATTTNYGWTTPDDTALVKDGASAIRTLGTSVDTTTKNLNPSTTLGDIEYRSSTSNTNTRLGIGTTGQVLTVSGGVPSWATPAAGGSWTQIATGSITGSQIDITGLTGKKLLLICDGISVAGGSGTSDIYFGVNNFASVLGNGYSASNTFSIYQVGANLNKTSSYYLWATFDLCNTTAQAKPILSSSDSSSTRAAWTTSSITQLNIKPEAGNTFDAGTYYVWSQS
jgi:hypothetical protein